MNDKKQSSFTVYRTTAMAVDPIHVGTGGSHLGRVDNSIVRDPVTRIPKIPGSSLAGVHRAYAAMAFEDNRDKTQRETPYYPNCAGQGQSKEQGHCGEKTCPICSTFGHASFAGLAGFSDAHVLLFPVPSREGPVWVTSPGALAFVDIKAEANDDNVYRKNKADLNLGWMLLPGDVWPSLNNVETTLKNLEIPKTICESINLVSDKLFGHIVNSNLEVRTSVAINPATGAADDGALFTYEALPRSTVLVWELTCRNPRHFDRAESSDPHKTVKEAQPLLEALGIGGMGSRGMGRLRVLSSEEPDEKKVISGKNDDGEVKK